MAVSTRMSPNQREALSAISTVTNKQEYLTSTGGALNVNGAGGTGGGTSSTFGSTFPTVGTAVGAISSTGNMAGLNLTAAGNLRVDGSGVTQPVTISAGSAVIGHVIVDSGALSVTGGKSNNGNVPGSTNVGALVALANAAAPAWTEGNEVLLSVDLTGKVRTLTQVTNGTNTMTVNGDGSLLGQVYNTGTFAVQATLQAGTAIAGKVGIDQTTPGTTNNVSVSASSGAGTSSLIKDITQFGDGVTSGVLDVGMSLYNGATYDRWRTNSNGIALVQQAAATATLANIAGTLTSTTLLAANTLRKGAQIYNDSTSVLYVKFGTTASSTSFTIPLAAATYYEVPAGYNGIISGVWVLATGNARVTEET